MKMIRITLIILAIIAIKCSIPHLSKKQINDLIANTKINYGSTVRIKANAFNY